MRPAPTAGRRVATSLPWGSHPLFANTDLPKDVLRLTNEGDARRKAQAAYDAARRDDPKEELPSTRTLRNAFKAAESVENQKKGKSGQARGLFG